jgi:archaellum biogenesis ATPase FlaH
MKLPTFLTSIKLSDDQKWKLLIAFIIPFFLKQCHTNTKIDEAQEQAASAKQMSEMQAKQIDEVKEQNEELLSLVKSLADKKELTRKQIITVDSLSNNQLDSNYVRIRKQRKSLNDLFNETFKNLQK